DGFEVASGTDPTDPNSKPKVPTITVRGIGAAALRGGDLTDPENDGVDATGAGADPVANGWNWVSIFSNNEPDFEGGEFSYNIFDNKVGGGNDKWCCDAPPVAITVEFAEPVSLDSFTVTSSNDTPDRDPRVWGIYGSNDGITFIPIFEQNDTTAQLWTERNQVLEFTLPNPTPPYKFIRYAVTASAIAVHALNEIEYFGTLGPQTPLKMTNITYNEVDDTLRFTWTSKPNKTYSLFYSADLTDFGADINDNIGSQGDMTTFPPMNEPALPNPLPGAPMLYFRAQENP
ncbi:MAG TPA: discoidin domain-containing protein, partial [Pirellulaceae bacterium]